MTKIIQHDNIDTTNQFAMKSTKTVKHYVQADYLTSGEKKLFDSVKDEASGRTILDIGVGGGRTISYLTAISEEYTAIDYVEEMVKVTKKRFPDKKVLHADARDMSIFPDKSFYMIVFSNAGIDMVDEIDRIKILNEVKRLLQPGGVFLFSTHNLDYRKNLSEPVRPKLFMPFLFTINPIIFSVRVLKSFQHTVKMLFRLQVFKNYRKTSSLNKTFEDWAILNTEYHDYCTMMHYITCEAQLTQLKKHGFGNVEIICNSDGEPILNHNKNTPMLYFKVRGI
jgi:ubiquinone/menaquinone biosynthesis C-methylase UbiE